MSYQADLVLVGGRIRTPAHPSGFAQALGVRDGVIQALSTDEEIRELAGAGTRVIDLRGGLALPAFSRRVRDSANAMPVNGSTSGA